MNPTSTEPTRDGTALSLCILRGVHAGARRDALGAVMLVVGSADDCDMILADPGIAAHHAIIRVSPSGWSARALDGAIGSDTRRIAPGDSLDLGWFEVATLGPVALSVGESDSPLWDSLFERDAQADTGPVPATTRSTRRKRLLVAAIGVPVCVATAITAASLRPVQDPPAPSQRSLLERTVQEVSLEKSEIRQDTQGKLQVSGLASDDAKVDRLRDHLAARGVVAEVNVRSGKDIARDVAEVLRLSDLRAETTYRGNGEIGIRGHFGDGKALDAALASRALRDVNGLTKVAIVNLDKGAPAPAPVAADAEARHIIVAVGGADPYVVTGDGSRYFAGARLPCGGHLRAVDGQQIFVDPAAGAGALDCTGAIVMTALNPAVLAGPPARSNDNSKPAAAASKG